MMKRAILTLLAFACSLLATELKAAIRTVSGLSIPQQGSTTPLNAALFAPDSSLWTSPYPLVTMPPGGGADIDSVEWDRFPTFASQPLSERSRRRENRCMRMVARCPGTYTDTGARPQGRMRSRCGSDGNSGITATIPMSGPTSPETSACPTKRPASPRPINRPRASPTQPGSTGGRTPPLSVSLDLRGPGEERPV